VRLGWPIRTVTIARIRAIEITLTWRWAPVLVLCTWLLAQNVLPASFPSWAAGTTWLTSAAVVVAGEIALLLHELSHALVARGRGENAIRIVFHGFRAETVVSPDLPAPAREALIALVGPGMNLALAGLAVVLRLGLATQGPIDVLLLSLILGNAAMAVMSLVPFSGSDGRRALSAFYRARAALAEAQVASQGQDQDDQDQQTQRRQHYSVGCAASARTA
jgi:Zn-dependent protease